MPLNDRVRDLAGRHSVVEADEADLMNQVRRHHAGLDLDTGPVRAAGTGERFFIDPVARPLAAQRIDRPAVVFDGQEFLALLGDMGPNSVDGWMAGLVAAELGIVETGILDVDARELVLDDQRIALTRLEFEVMHYLCQNDDKAVTRVDLLERVWGYDYDGGSNVVDVIIRSLRNKLAERAFVIETVRGTGYRYRGE